MDHSDTDGTGGHLLEDSSALHVRLICRYHACSTVAYVERCYTTSESIIPVLTGDANLSVAVGITVATEGVTLCPAYAVVNVVTRLAQFGGASVVFEAVMLGSASFKH